MKVAIALQAAKVAAWLSNHELQQAEARLELARQKERIDQLLENHELQQAEVQA